MKTPSERLKDAVEWVFTTKPAPDKPSWGERLALWGLGVMAKSAVKFLDDAEPEARDNVKDVLTALIANPNTPPHVKALAERALEPKSWIQIVVLVIMGVVMLIQSIQAIFPPGLKRMEQEEERVAQTYRLDPISVITAWRRDPAKYEPFFDDLKVQGWTDDRIEALKFFTLFYPAPQDLINWQAKEVFEPNMVTKYGLKDELGALERDSFYKAGMTDEQIDNYWMAHWEHPELRTIIEMLRRTDFSEEDMRAWFRLVEIPPYWRDKLIQISYEIPTRVDVRRWWDMRTITEARLKEIYAHQGYHGEDLNDYVLWTKVYVAFPDLIARWKNGWITIDEVRAELTGYGMPADRLEELLQTKFKATQGEHTAAERDITKTDIIKGVKKGVITRGEGIELLMDMGYDEDEADYILAINIPVDEEDVVIKERELTKADILKGFKAELLSEAQVLEKLEGIRYSQLDAEFLLKIYKALANPPTEPRSREASKADIIQAVKKGLISAEDGYLMLQDIGFTPEAAQFILIVKAEVSPFSPASYQEFKDLTGKWRKITSMAPDTMQENIRQAAGEVVKLTGDLKSLKALVREEERKIGQEEDAPEEATARLKELRVALHRAEATLAEAKTNYDALVAEWRTKE